MRTILILAGGTGGHVFPALACAHNLQQQGYNVHWLGTKNGIEVKVTAQHDIPLHTIKISGIRGKGKLSLLLAPFKIACAIWQSIKIIYKLKPSCVLGFGGYVTGPSGIASWIMRIPLVIHEQNAVLGTTNRLLARFAQKHCEGFAGTFPASNKVVYTGNPVRSTLLAVANKEPLIERPFRILILGGSLGAEPINHVVPKVLTKLNIDTILHVVHQAGIGNDTTTERAYAEFKHTVHVVDFIQDMQGAYSWADLVICRAGALTIAELAATGTGAIFIPLPHAIDDHQTRNAQFVVKAKAGIMLKQTPDLESKLITYLNRLLTRSNIVIKMGDNAKKIARINATDLVLEACKQVQKNDKN